jgi:hypothetical protein
VKKVAALILLGSALSLWAQDKPHRFVELGVDAAGSFANSYLRTGDVFKEKIVLDVSKMADDLGNGLGVFFDARWKTFLNFNLGAVWGFGFFVGMDARGQFKIPQSMVELLSEGNDADKTYSEKFGLGAAAFFETGVQASAKIRRIKFTVRPAYFLPLAYVSSPRVDYTFALKDNGSVTVEGNYRADLYTALPRENVEALNEGMNFNALQGLDIAGMIGKGGVDLLLRAEYPVYHNFVIGGTLGYIPLIPAQLEDKYSLTGGFSINKTLEDLIHNDIELPDIEFSGSYDQDHTVIFRPFKIGADAVYRPFNIRLLTLRPEAALVFNSIYDTPVFLDLA